MEEKKTSKLYAIVHGKCPQCRRGDIFTGSLYGFNVQRTNTVCPKCSQRFEIEPGYFYAAMYVSYAMNCSEMIALGIATYVLSGGNLAFESFWLYLTVIFTGCLLLAPLTIGIPASFYYIGSLQKLSIMLFMISHD